ncbi:MAG: 4Fe-4S dicluster domain-containing protein, partial [Burkholderiaceae bacterium]
EKCTFCYPRIESGQPTVCSETCVGRIRYLGVLLYDADRIEEAASVEHDKNLYASQLSIFLDPNDPKVIAQAKKDGVPDAWLAAAKNSPVYKMAVDWRVALPLHPEYRTLPMVWYIPPLSPVQSRAEAGQVAMKGELPDVASLRIPVQYLANMLTAGDPLPVTRALERMMAMRSFMRGRHVDGIDRPAVLEQVGLSVNQVETMYRVMAIANYEDRFVVPTTHREYAENAYDLKGSSGFSFGNEEAQHGSLFGAKRKVIPIKEQV